MVLDVSVYLAVFAVCIVTASLYQKVIIGTRIRGVSIENRFAGAVMYCMVGCFFLFPIIAMYGLRYGIGTDYFSYEDIFNTFHTASLREYWGRHNEDVGFFYVEPAYYVLNRIFPSYRALLWGMGMLYFSLLLLAVRNYFRKIEIPFALFVFLSTQFIYSLNATRFAIALCFLLLGYSALAQDKTWKFVIYVLAGALFHKSVLFCLALIFLKKYKYRQANNARNVALFCLIIFFPLVSKYLLLIAEKLPVFERYFSTIRYSASGTMAGEWKWLLHVVPVFLPLLVLCRKEIFGQEETRTYFRICIMEVPFRMLGLLNTWYTRTARWAQIAQVIFIPLVLSKVTDKRKKGLLYLYYIIWYIFYFAYYAIANDQGDSLPYVWILSR